MWVFVFDYKILDGFEQLVDSGELHFPPILFLNVFIDVVVLSELVAFEIIGEVVEIPDCDCSPRKDIDELRQFYVAIFVDALQLLKVFLRLPLLHRELFYYRNKKNAIHQLQLTHTTYQQINQYLRYSLRDGLAIDQQLQYREMGSEICVGANRQQPLAQIQSQQNKVALQAAPKQSLKKKILKERVEVNAFPMLNKHVEERIKKLTNHPQNTNKIWKIRQPYNIIYANTDQQLSEQLPKGCVQIYKLRDNGEFQGYFQGYLNESNEPELNGAIFVYPNASYFVGSSSAEGTYANEVTNLNYTGGWRNEEPHGQGVEKNNKGTYKGEYSSGQKQGKGRFEWNNGSIYQGSFLKGLFHGRGSIIDRQGKYTYQGQFRAGQKHGKGNQSFQFEEYSGDFYKGKRTGKGVLKIYNKDRSLDMVYEGQFCKGLPNGRGKLVKQQNNTIQGVWQDGQLMAACS